LTSNELEIKKISIDVSKLDDELEKDLSHVYNLSKEYPIKVSIYSTLPGNSLFLSIIIHHIAFDGWSVDIFLRELQIYYSYYFKKSQNLESDLHLPELSIQYKDFAIWQRSYLTGERLDQQLNYWKKYKWVFSMFVER
jgi:hypothetical protein